MSQTMISSPTYGDIYFDAVLKVSHEATVTATEHPVELGVSITDHAYIEPEKVSLSIGASDVMGEDGHSKTMFETLRSILREREPLTLVTRFQTYTDMLLVAMSVPDEYSIMNGMKAELQFRHIEIVTAQVVKVQAKIKSSKSSSDSNFKSSDTGAEDDALDVGWGSALSYFEEAVSGAEALMTGKSSGGSLVKTQAIDTSKYKTASDMIVDALAFWKNGG